MKYESEQCINNLFWIAIQHFWFIESF